MFLELTNFAYDRTKLQAVGFYIVYLVVSVVVSDMLGGVVALFSGNADNIIFSRYVARFIEAGISVWLGVTILTRKNLLLTSRKYGLLGLSFILAIGFGGLLSLIPAAYFTTRKVLSSSHTS